MFAGSFLTAKVLTRYDSAEAIVLWQHLGVGLMTLVPLVFVEQLPSAAVGYISRRRFLRGLGALGLASGLAIAGLSLRLVGTAHAIGTCSGGACGPSPLCKSSNCSGSTCTHLALNRPYGKGYCGTGSNYWSETWACNCASPGTWRCGDCCEYNGAGSLCADCGQFMWKCICRRRMSSECPNAVPNSSEVQQQLEQLGVTAAYRGGN